MNIVLNLLFHLHHETEEERPSDRAYREVLALIRQADALPIDCAWLAEHHLSPTRGRLPAPLLMAVVAARETRRVRVGPCVLVTPLHAPLDLAEQIATADLLCEGRLVVGLGSGGNPEEFAAFGVPLEERRERYAEGAEIIRRALSGRPFSFQGAHYTVPEVSLVPALIQPVESLLWLAAGSVHSAALAGSSGAHLLLARGAGITSLGEQVGAYRVAREARGLAPGKERIQVTRGLYVAPSEEEAWREAEHGIAAYLRASGRLDRERDLRALAARGDFIVGTPVQCAAAIRELVERVPITDLACDIFLHGMEHRLMARSLDLLGREVAPLLG